MKKINGLVIALVILGVLVLWGVFSYNGFVSAEQSVEQSYSNIQADLQRRADLIPNLVETVKGYASHEKDIINNIADARARLAGAKTINEQASANASLETALSRLLVVVENYPNLKADANFRQLMDNLEGTENRIKVARIDYNKAVQNYNSKVKKFPGVIFARLFGFNSKQYFEAAPGSQNPPQVNFEG